MHRSLTGTARPLVAIVLAFQALALIGVPLAHAVAEARAPLVAIHVEGEDAPPCPPGHDEALCHLCQFTKLQLLRAGGAAERAPLALGALSATPALPELPGRAFHASPAARAPPLS